MKTFGWIIFAFFAIIIGIYPFTYLVFDMSQGFLASKEPLLKESAMWQASFYTHILLGAVALMAGWSQFSKKLRNRNLVMHRTLGKIYLTAVALSGIAGLYLAYHATGGVVAALGFAGLSLSWVITAVMGYVSIRNKNIDQHQYWMIRSYALCFAAVTLRIWLPLFQFALGLEFIFAYRIIAWFCWVPNLVVAELIVSRINSRRTRVVVAE